MKKLKRTILSDKRMSFMFTVFVKRSRLPDMPIFLFPYGPKITELYILL